MSALDGCAWVMYLYLYGRFLFNCGARQCSARNLRKLAGGGWWVDTKMSSDWKKKEEEKKGEIANHQFSRGSNGNF